MKKSFERKRFKKVYLAGAAALALIIVGAAATSSLGAVARPTLAVTTANAEFLSISGAYSVTGTLSPVESAGVSSKASGRVIQVAVQKGDTVHAGDLLVRLDDTDIQLAAGSGGLASDMVEKYKVAYDLANQLYHKNKTLFDNGAISEVTCEQSRVSMEQARIQYETAAAALSDQLDKTAITAPIDGIVVAVSVQEGDSVSQGASIASIVGMEQVILKGTVPENVVASIAVGQDVTVTSPSQPGKTFSGKVSFISPVSVPAGQIFPIEVTIANPEGALKAGMTAGAGIRIDSGAPVLAVPAGAVFSRDGREWVYVVADDRVKLTEVVSGISSDAWTAILSGIDEGTPVVSEHATRLMDGDPVTVKEEL